MPKPPESKKLPISVFIICKNEADRIHYPILSTKDWADEVIVIDSGSTDGTMERAEELGATQVVFNEWPGYGPQKNYGESLCRNDWLLNLDADEQASPELVTAIKELFTPSSRPNLQHDSDEGSGEISRLQATPSARDDELPQPALYAIRNVMVFPHETKPRRFSPEGYFVRLYRKDTAGFKPSTVHDSVTPKQPLDTINIEAPVHHYGFRDFRHMIEKMNNYTDMQAADMVARGKRIPAWRIFTEPSFAFFKSYILRKYCLFGAEGMAHSVFYAFNRTMRLAKTRELWKLKNKPSDINQGS
jgi:glycosyltransferase involved in cell wall biosynthesis